MPAEKFGQEFSCFLGEPIRCARPFMAQEAVARTETQPDDSETELEPAAARPQMPAPLLTSAACPESTPAARLTKNQKKNARDREIRRKKRMLSGLGGGGLKSCARKYRKLAKKHSLAVDADAQDLPHSRPGWVGLQEVKADQNIYGLKELLEKFGLRLVPWDGITTRLLVDSEDRVIGILGGQPKNAKEWEKICKEAVEALENGRGLCTFLDKQLNHGRGDFPAVAVGISHGNGTQAPGVLSQGKNAKVLGDLLGMSCFAKMAGFANCLFATYFPRAYALYQENLEELIQWDPSLRRNFPKTAFAAASFNFGPKTECYPHRDWANVSWGECAVTALGDYNADEGGHLVLWDLGLVVRFPPGSTVLIPSALVRHSNTPIAPCEHRYSFAQYSAGGLFRWVGRGFRLAKAKPAESTDIQQSRWTKGMGVFSKLSEF